jgi:ankyrin repeat protein
MTPLLHSIRKYTMYDTHPFTLPLLKREDLREINARDASGRTALFIAIYNLSLRSKERGERDWDVDRALDSLLAKKGVDINLADNNGMTPLLLAVSISACSAAGHLLSRPEITNLNARDVRGRTAFYISVESGFFHLAEHFLQRNDVDVCAASNTGMTPLLLAVKNGLYTLALKILAKNNLQLLNAVDDTGKSALHYAAAKNNQDIVDAMLAKEGVDINLADKSGCTPLIAAINNGNTEIALKLIARMDAASLNAKDENGVSALFAAVTTANDGVIDALLAKDGIDINTRTNEQNTPFLEALRLGNVRIANKFLAREEVNVTVVNKYSLNALLWAVHKGPAMLDNLKKLLLRPDVDIDILNQRTKEGWSALMLALRASYAEAVELLLATQKVNTNIVSGDDQTALKIAAAKNDIKTLNLLLDHGADVNQADAKGDTLLIHGVKSDNRAIVRVALDRGASVAHKNASGDNALLLAVKNGNTLMLGYLLERLAAAPQPEVDVNEIFLAAVKLDDAGSLRKLLDHARQPQGLNKDINEAFIEAVTRNNEAMIDIIYQYGVDLNYACDKTGRTALETALDLKLKIISSKLLKFESDAKLRLDVKPVNEVAADVPNNAEPARQPSLLSKHFLLRVKEVLPGTGVPELSTSASEAGVVVDGDVTIDYSKAFC